MPSGDSFSISSNNLRPARYGMKLASYAGMYAVILISALGPSRMCAQATSDPCDAAILVPPPPPPPPPPQCSSPTPPTQSTPANIADGAKKALADEWIASEQDADYVLQALGLLTSGPQVPNVNNKVLDRLKKGSSGDDDVLYRAALGEPDRSGRPTVEGQPDFLDTLAKANNLPKPKDDEDKLNYKAALFICTQDIVNDLFDAKSGKGKLALPQINQSFEQKDQYAALYQLLDAVWQENDAKHLEKLRAAFAENADDLAKQIAAKISAPKN
jgi:hypothetical protein